MPYSGMVTGDLLERTTVALTPLWALPAPGPTDLSADKAYIAFKSFCIDTFDGADKSLGFAFALPDALRAAGLPCAMRGPASPRTLEQGARAFLQAFSATTIRRRYLCPLDLADAVPTLRFGNASVGQHNKAELRELFDRERLARHYPNQPFDDRLAQFQWLIVEEDVAAPVSAGQRAVPFLYENMSRDLGAIEPHAGTHPDAVTDALFGLLLAPWEDWHRNEYDWRGFSIPWIHIATDDLFIRPRPAPTADTLNREDASHHEWDGEVIEYERPIRLYLDDEAEALLVGFDAAWWSRIEAAQATALFETPVKHFLVRAALSDGMDQIMAHMTTIEAALGLQSDFRNKGRPKADQMSATTRLTKRVEALLGDPQAGLAYAALFETRSSFVHGRPLPGAVSSNDRNLARSLARRVVLALIDAASGPAALGSREDYLTGLA